jgi:hypothetical protein
VFYAGETGSCVVAEGVETQSELATLKRLGVHRGAELPSRRPGPSRRSAWRRPDAAALGGASAA